MNFAFAVNAIACAISIFCFFISHNPVCLGCAGFSAGLAIACID